MLAERRLQAVALVGAVRGLRREPDVGRLPAGREVGHLDLEPPAFDFQRLHCTPERIAPLGLGATLVAPAARAAVGRPRRGKPRGVEPRAVIVEVPRERLDPTVGHQQEVVRCRAQQVTIVGDEYDGALVLLQRLRERIPHVDVEVVRRLVEQQQVRPLPDDQGQGQPGLLSARETPDRGERLLAGEPETSEERAQVLLPGVRRKARQVAERVGYPVVVRPSYVLGGRGMAIVFDAGALDRYMIGAVDVSHDRPVLIDRFLEDAFEFDVDAVADTTGAVVIGGIMEHIEEAGIHSGDSSCVVPPFMVAERHLATIRDYTRRIGRALKVIGLMNIQFALKDDTVYVLEVNPRSSRTVPYISKATGVPLAKVAARVAAGRTLADLGLVADLEAAGVFVKSPVFPFVRFPGVDTILGPEMKSTGEVMGGADNFGAAFGKAMMGAGQRLPEKGCVFISVNNSDKPTVVPIARDLAQLGFTLTATRGTAAFLRVHGIEVEVIFKVNEGRPNIADQIVNRKIDLVINTPLGRDSFFDDRAVRRAATNSQVPCITTLTGASAAVAAIKALRAQALTVRSLQDYYAGVEAGA